MATISRAESIRQAIHGDCCRGPKDLNPSDLPGTEDIGPEDTFDGDCGRLLERVYVKGMASPMPASWNQIAGWLRQIDALREAA